MSQLPSPVHVFILSQAEKLVNTALKFDEETQQKLQAYTHRVIQVTFTDLQFHCYVYFHEQGIQLLHEWQHKPDLCLTGASLDMLALAKQAVTPAKLMASNIQFQGELGFSQGLQDILQNLHIDWEEALSQYLGDIAAHQVAYHGKRAFNWIKEVKNGFKETVSEYLPEEAQLVPPSVLFQDFNEAVSILRNDVERLEQRLQRMEQNQ